MIRCYDMVEVKHNSTAWSNVGPVIMGKCLVRADCLSTEQAIEWLSNHIHGYLKINHDAEEGIWRCRWSGWPFLRAAGAGKTMDESIRRCHMHARVVRRRDREWKDADARAHGFKDYNDMMESYLRDL